MNMEAISKASIAKLGENNPMYGRKHSLETIMKIRASGRDGYCLSCRIAIADRGIVGTQ